MAPTQAVARRPRSRTAPDATPLETHGLPGSLGPGLLAFLAAIPVALAMAAVAGRAGGAPERAVMLSALLLAGAAPLPLALYLVRARRQALPGTAALIALATLGVLALAITMYALSSEVMFRGDFLVWSESDFVNDIIKFRVGYPLFSAQVNNESFTYPPLSQLLTYLLASLAGKGTSVAAYRTVQVLYTTGAALLAVACARRIVAVALGERASGGVADARLWSALWLPVFALLATNPITNPYIVNLHGDGLAQLVTLLAFWLMLRYAMQRERWVLVAMAVVPAVGFLAKQSLLIWGAFYALQLAFFDRPRSLRRFLAFGAASGALFAGLLALCYALWGQPFFYWTFTVLGSHGVSPLRAFDHVRAAWPFFAMALVGGLLLLDDPRTRRLLLGPWLAAFVLLASEAYTSGVAWMLNHMGPGSLLAGVWFVAALTARYGRDPLARAGGADAGAWLRAGMAAGCGVLLLMGTGVLRVPLPVLDPDANRYAAAIEREFRDLPPQDVLLDVGSWVYLPSGTVMKDRAPSIGERGYSLTGDFSGILRRLNERKYARIVLRDFNAPDFWYDNALWPRSSGIRAALQANYREVRVIPAARESPVTQGRYTLHPISVLEPKAR
ncbi:MAG TPA: hypothetical protein VF832_16065 [Longimicrobiales bacterium]